MKDTIKIFVDTTGSYIIASFYKEEVNRPENTYEIPKEIIEKLRYKFDDSRILALACIQEFNIRKQKEKYNQEIDKILRNKK